MRKILTIAAVTMRPFVLTALMAAAVPPFLGNSASAGVFTFEQQTSSVAGLTVAASIGINGDLSDLPTVSCNTEFPSSCNSPFDFGALFAFSLQTNGVFGLPNPVTLSNFTQPPSGEILIWSISPSEIAYNNSESDFELIFDFTPTLTRIYVNTDDGSGFGCEITDHCYVTGVFVPEPPTICVFCLLITLAALQAVSNGSPARRASAMKARAAADPSTRR